jgi:two-component system, NtrC family, response regulator
MAVVLIIDDEEIVCDRLGTLLRSDGHVVESASGLRDGVKKLFACRPDLVFLDLNPFEDKGLDIISEIKRASFSPELIIITDDKSSGDAAFAFKNGVWDYVQKPLSAQSIRLSLSRALRYREEKRSLKTPLNLLRTKIIGSSSEIDRCLELLAKAANTGVNVIITGETGTGKDLFARAIHENSRRAGGNFVAVDCTSLPVTLVESVLFGHEKGSFTGADQGKAGLIRHAHGGTLFLDEVGELPLEIQKKFLRVLQEHHFRPLGSMREIASDFRLVAATNRDLKQMVKEGKFREDLLFRLRVLVLDLPPLRERREDIVVLAMSRLEKLCKWYQMPLKEVCPGFMELLLQYDWPGNVRELFNVIETALVHAQNESTLYAMHLPPEIRVKVKFKRAKADSAGHESGGSANLPSGVFPHIQQVREEALCKAEQSYLANLLQFATGDMRRAAELSGLSRSQLYRLMQRYRLGKAGYS